ncbi:hypothetical protein TIFTF001_002665 [Ficus carica]|uniref:Uncharacterized protein n=1 Tax=Ficus carica TaxID=3494 RepID=A0AA88CSM0_FICCA|nr:hypothetical protein TIFTF001_002665 [Ficus carica]
MTTTMAYLVVAKQEDDVAVENETTARGGVTGVGRWQLNNMEKPRAVGEER